MTAKSAPLAAALLLSTTFLATASTPADLIAEIGATAPDSAGALQLRDVDLRVGPGLLRVREGVLLPTTPVRGRTLEWVFAGEARFEFEPPDPVEAGQLELFTGQTSLSTAVTAAILLLGEEERLDAFLPGGQEDVSEPARVNEAAAFYESWKSSIAREESGIESVLLRMAHGDELFRDYAALWMLSPELGEFYCLFDPSAQEQIELGQFVPREIGEHDAHVAGKRLRRAQRRGFFLGSRMEEYGNWDLWVSSPALTEDGRPDPGDDGIRPERYVLDGTITKAERGFTGRARIEMKAEQAGLNTVAMFLYPDLEVTAVRHADGTDLEWYRSDWDIVVFLRQPTTANESLALEVDYRGQLLVRLEYGLWGLRSPSGWYPRAGYLEPAPHEFTLRWPKGLDLVGSGRVLEEGIDENARWERRSVALPTNSVSFELGSFQTASLPSGHVEIEVAFPSMKSPLVSPMELAAIVAEAVAFFEKKFGPYPLDRLTVALTPRTFSQGNLGFISLSMVLFPDVYMGSRVYRPDQEAELRYRRLVEEVAHGVAYQWWSTQVQPSSYRDLWLVEALAGYAEHLFAEYHLHEGALLAQDAEDWKRSFHARAKNYRHLYDLGPVTMGNRLISSKSNSAYLAVLYDKGPTLISMLATDLGESRLIGSLKRIVANARHGTIDTATFLRGIGKISIERPEPFAEQFVYGTDVPEIHYTYDVKPLANGQWVVQGETRQLPSLRSRHRLVQTETGRWDVRSESESRFDTARSSFFVPCQVREKSRAVSAAAGGATGSSSRYMVARTRIVGEESRYHLDLRYEPERFWLDRHGEAVGRFYCASCLPRVSLILEARWLSAMGELERAEEMFDRAMDAPLGEDLFVGSLGDDPGDEEMVRALLLGPDDAGFLRSARPGQKRKWLDRITTACVHIGRARVFLEQGKDDQARAEIQAGEKLLKGLEKDRLKGERIVLKSRLDLRNGDAASAFDRLADSLRMHFPQRGDESTVEQARRVKFRDNPLVLGGDAYALLAAAACTTDHEAVCQRAVVEARQRDADVDLLMSAVAAE